MIRLCNFSVLSVFLIDVAKGKKKVENVLLLLFGCCVDVRRVRGKIMKSHTKKFPSDLCKFSRFLLSRLSRQLNKCFLLLYKSINQRLLDT